MPKKPTMDGFRKVATNSLEIIPMVADMISGAIDLFDKIHEKWKAKEDERILRKYRGAKKK